MKNVKHLILAGGLAMALAGCQTASSPTAQKIAATINNAVQTVKDTAGTVKEKAKIAQTYTSQICGYVPLLESAIAVFNSGFSNDAGVVANAICNAVTSIPLADGPGDRKPRVNGVVIKGNFVK